MKKLKLSLFSRVTLWFCFVLAFVSIFFTLFGYFSTIQFYEESTQFMNKDVAFNIAKYWSPYSQNGLNRKRADSIFLNFMVINPRADVYFLDTIGHIVYFHSQEKNLKRTSIPMSDIRLFLKNGGKSFIKGIDPRDPYNRKIFSVAKAQPQEKNRGFIYVIFNSRDFKTVNEMFIHTGLVNSVKGFLIVLFLSFIITLFYFSRLGKAFRELLHILSRFRNGDLQARFELHKIDEFKPVRDSFNTMADLLSLNLEKVKRTEEQRKNLIANISHDLRTPLSLIRGYSETLLMQEKNKTKFPQNQHYSEIILGNISKLEKMVNQLFELSKMESVQFKPELEATIFIELFIDIILEARIRAEKKNIQFTFDPIKTTDWVMVDLGLMERLIQNLVDNAINHTPNGGKIEIIIQKISKELIFSISNTGLPLNTEIIDFMGSGRNVLMIDRPRKGGSGLGLSIIKKILDIHELDYTFQTLHEERNVFSFSIPVLVSIK